jgi:hypothetical protein
MTAPQFLRFESVALVNGQSRDTIIKKMMVAIVFNDTIVKAA